MEKRIILMAIAMMALLGAKAQGDDFGIWTEANLEKKVSKKFTMDTGVEFRTRDNAGEADRWSASIGASYKLASGTVAGLPASLKLSAGYTFLYDNNHKLNNSGKKYADYWGSRARFNLSLGGSLTAGRLGISLRERWQYTYRPERTVERYRVADDVLADEHTYNGKAKSLWRQRLQLKYKLNKEWRPYVAGETFVGGSGFDKLRLAAGTEIRLTKQHWLDVKYLFQKAYDDDDSEGNRHVLAIGYTYKF